MLCRPYTKSREKSFQKKCYVKWFLTRHELLSFFKLCVSALRALETIINLYTDSTKEKIIVKKFSNEKNVLFPYFTLFN